MNRLTVYCGGGSLRVRRLTSRNLAQPLSIVILADATPSWQENRQQAQGGTTAVEATIQSFSGLRGVGRAMVHG